MGTLALITDAISPYRSRESFVILNPGIKAKTITDLNWIGAYLAFSLRPCQPFAYPFAQRTQIQELGPPSLLCPSELGSHASS